MRKTRNGLSFVSAALLGLAGCWTTDKPPKPTPNPEEFILPPDSEARFSQPPNFPAKSMNENFRSKDRDKEDTAPAGFRGPSRMGSGGMSGPGGY
jgi:hypothetical protein